MTPSQLKRARSILNCKDAPYPLWDDARKLLTELVGEHKPTKPVKKPSESKWKKCEYCNGTGDMLGMPKYDCRACNGRGGYWHA